MLPSVAPQARIMRYGYQSQWFGEGAMRQRASTIARRLLLALKRKRAVLYRLCTAEVLLLLILLGVWIAPVDFYSALLWRAYRSKGMC
jgi:hypothetical protein